jgi:hypothetical protein
MNAERSSAARQRVSFIDQAHQISIVDWNIVGYLLGKRANAVDHIEDLLTPCIRRDRGLPIDCVLHPLAERFHALHHGCDLGAVTKGGSDRRGAHHVQGLRMHFSKNVGKTSGSRSCIRRGKIGGEVFQISETKPQAVDVGAIIGNSSIQRHALGFTGFSQRALAALDRRAIGEPSGKDGAACADEPCGQNLAPTEQAAYELRELPAAGAVDRSNVRDQQKGDDRDNDHAADLYQLNAASAHMATMSGLAGLCREPAEALA